MTQPTVRGREPGTELGFRHEALLYEGEDGFVDVTAPFLREGIERGEPALVVVSGPKIGLLRDELGADARHVQFAEMGQVGANPARIIPAWQDFLDDHPGEIVRGIGEPIYPERSPTELDECVRHEALLNVAFEGGRPWWLVCPYDLAALDPLVVHEAHRTHPGVWEAGSPKQSDDYMPAWPFAGVLADPPGAAPVVRFTSAPFDGMRALVDAHAVQAGLSAARRADLLLAVSELAANSLRHGGGWGELRVWHEDDGLVCEIRDEGVLTDPLAGRRRPSPAETGGRGLWLVNQLCDLAQLRSSAAGTTIRIFVRD